MELETVFKSSKEAEGSIYKNSGTFGFELFWVIAMSRGGYSDVIKAWRKLSGTNLPVFKK